MVFHQQATYEAILNDLNRDVARAQPVDVWQYCSNWFNSKLEEQRVVAQRAGHHPVGADHLNSRSTPFGSDQFPLRSKPSLAGHGYIFGGTQTIASLQERLEHDQSPYTEVGPTPTNVQAPPHAFGKTPTLPRPTSSSPLRSSQTDHDVNSPTTPLGIPLCYNLGRRTSVSAESLDPAAASPTNKLVIPKSTSQRARIEASIKGNLLFRNLDEDQHNDVLNAMKEVHVPAGTEVIVQGAVGDFFYVVEEGQFEVWVTPPAQHAYDPVAKTTATTTGPPKKVATIEAGGSFGELALMYNAPRAATVLAMSSTSTLWALDRVTFRSILMEHTSRKRKMYEVFLAEVGILASLEPHERAKIADALEEKVYDEGEPVVVQGEVGKNFYIIESGQAEVTKRQPGEETEERVMVLGKGDYFGELALLNSAPRAATVKALAGAGRLRVATLGEKAFTRLLGPVSEMLQRRAASTYKSSPSNGDPSAGASPFAA